MLKQSQAKEDLYLFAMGKPAKRADLTSKLDLSFTKTLHATSSKKIVTWSNCKIIQGKSTQQCRKENSCHLVLPVPVQDSTRGQLERMREVEVVCKMSQYTYT